jgi:2-keto-3-deoxy-L-rhamnonate aldolase RhmA
MKINSVKQKLSQDQPAYGWSLYLGSPLVAEALTDTGIDFLMCDTQHGSFGHGSPRTTTR